MARITKGMISAANRELDCIWGLATEEGNPNPASPAISAASASNYIATLVAAGQPLPSFIDRQFRFLKAMDWRFDINRPGLAEVTTKPGALRGRTGKASLSIHRKGKSNERQCTTWQATDDPGYIAGVSGPLRVYGDQRADLRDHAGHRRVGARVSVWRQLEGLWGYDLPVERGTVTVDVAGVGATPAQNRAQEQEHGRRNLSCDGYGV